MKRLIVVSLFFFWPLACFAERPYLTCDPPPVRDYVQWYEVQGLPETYIVRKIQPRTSETESFRLDLTDLPIDGGPWTITARACRKGVCFEYSEPLVLESTPAGVRRGIATGKAVNSRGR